MRAQDRGIGVKTPLARLASREKLQRTLRVTPSVVDYTYFRSPWKGGHGPLDQEYLIKRGAFDDWWTRARPEGEPKGPPTRETGKWVRGYVEVMSL